MLSTANNSLSVTASQIDLNLGGFRVRLESLTPSAPLALDSSNPCYNPFIDPVTNHQEVTPDIYLLVEPAFTASDWQSYLPPVETPPDYDMSEGAWYYQHLDNGEEVFVIFNYYEAQTYFQVLRLDAGSRKGKLIYNANTFATPLDPALLLGFPLDRLLIVNRLMHGEGMLMHASAVGTEQGVLLFTGPSGAGKTTLCQLSQQFPDCTQLCDERIVVRFDPSSPTGFRAYGTPWPGEGNIYNRIDGPLAAIFLINHAKKNQLRPATGAAALGWLMQEIFPIGWSRSGLSFTLDFAANLVEKLPCYNYGFVPTPEAITYARQALKNPPPLTVKGSDKL